MLSAPVPRLLLPLFIIFSFQGSTNSPSSTENQQVKSTLPLTRRPSWRKKPVSRIYLVPWPRSPVVFLSCKANIRVVKKRVEMAHHAFSHSLTSPIEIYPFTSQRPLSPRERIPMGSSPKHHPKKRRLPHAPESNQSPYYDHVNAFSQDGKSVSVSTIPVKVN